MRLKDIPNATPDEMLRDLLDALVNLKNGHFTARMTDGFPGIYGEIARTLNQHMEMLARFSQEHHRLMEEIGVTGRLGGQMDVRGTAGAWQAMQDDVNRMGANVTNQFRDGANVVDDLLAGDHSARVTARNIRGEFAAFGCKLNKLADEFEQRVSDVAAT